MTTIDIFIHPDFIFEDTQGRYNPPSYNKYLDALIQRWDSSEMPILLQGIDWHKRFVERVSKEGAKFDTASYCMYDMPSFEVGEVHPNDWKGFTSLTDSVEADQIRIHGSFYGECLEGFAVQLYAHRYLGEHWHDWWGASQGIKKTRKYEKKKRKELEKQGAYQKSNIRYGIVHSPRKPKKVILRPKNRILMAFTRYPFGNITHQLTDQDTKLTMPEL